MADPLLRQGKMLKLIPRERKTTVKELQDKLEGLGYSGIVSYRQGHYSCKKPSTPISAPKSIFFSAKKSLTLS